MISASELRKLIDEKAEGTPHFVVDLAIHPGNKIMLEIDGDEGVSISDCVAFSRFVEHDVMNRDEEDFELSVKSPGALSPLRHRRQYNQHIGRTVKVKWEEGKVEGELKAVNEENIMVETRIKERVEGRKKKEWVVTEHTIPFDKIEETKIVISFK